MECLKKWLCKKEREIKSSRTRSRSRLFCAVEKTRNEKKNMMLTSAKILALCIFMSCGFNLASSASQPVSVKFKNSQKAVSRWDRTENWAEFAFMCNLNPVSSSIAYFFALLIKRFSLIDLLLERDQGSRKKMKLSISGDWLNHLLLQQMKLFTVLIQFYFTRLRFHLGFKLKHLPAMKGVHNIYVEIKISKWRWSRNVGTTSHLRSFTSRTHLPIGWL